LVHKKNILIPAVVIAFLIGMLGITFMPEDVKNRSLDFDKGTVKIDNSIINVEIAESDAERQRWLMFRSEKFPINSAMLLVYPYSDFHALWLLNVQFNLDILWFNEKGNLVYAVKNVSPCHNLFDVQNCTYKTTHLAKYILVSSTSFIEKHHIQNASKITLISV
jgi:uncharacterized membrane protein (UPF0127 family)